MDTQVRIKLRSSRAYFVLLLCIVLVLLLTISWLPLENGWRWFGYIGLLVSTVWLLRRDVALRSGRSCTSLVYGTDRQLTIEQRDGLRVSALVCADTLVSPWLILLNTASVNHGKRNLLLFPDAMAGEDYRRLQVLLRHSERTQSWGDNIVGSASGAVSGKSLL